MSGQVCDTHSWAFPSLLVLSPKRKEPLNVRGGRSRKPIFLWLNFCQPFAKEHSPVYPQEASEANTAQDTAGWISGALAELGLERIPWEGQIEGARRISKA